MWPIAGRIHLQALTWNWVRKEGEIVDEGGKDLDNPGWYG